jgi:hypothetical protein
MESNDQWQPTAPTPSGTLGGVPLDREALFEFLSSGRYKDFPSKQDATHPGPGPRTTVSSPVHVFYNGALSVSLNAGNAEHPAGAASVKEMFTMSGDLAGWAVMLKTGSRTEDGRGWFCYEVTSPTDSSALAAMGNGVTGCISCHSVGDRDMILSGYPLE